MSGRRLRLLGALGLFAAMLAMHTAPSAAAEPYDPWPGLVQDIFNNRPINDGNSVIGIEMPYRAEDAAIVP
ncbi:MAG TPA: quinoprotein dehydrogenase-associated SoxYZ-like carrier, partial [Xanthobacteraceae bacterium]|nr:quinoprotein dehydrogenase-associated SoxYZ-like carrier [Xanthobacteraceae bacterium]